MISKQLDLFLIHFDKQKYYDAHEAIEHIWFPRRFEKNDEVKLLKAFINAAVSFELAKRGKDVQSQKVWKNYLKYKNLVDKIDSQYIKKYHKIINYLDNI